MSRSLRVGIVAAACLAGVASAGRPALGGDLSGAKEFYERASFGRLRLRVDIAGIAASRES